MSPETLAALIAMSRRHALADAAIARRTAVSTLDRQGAQNSATEGLVSISHRIASTAKKAGKPKANHIR